MENNILKQVRVLNRYTMDSNLVDDETLVNHNKIALLS